MTEEERNKEIEWLKGSIQRSIARNYGKLKWLIILSVLFALLVANLTLIMVVQAKDYQGMAGNNHTIAKQATVKRGTISTADGVVLAESVPAAVR